MMFASHDYDVPLLEVNPALRSALQRLFPSGNIYHQVATRLFSFSKRVQHAAEQYSPMAGDCLVGLQIRYRKLAAPNVTTPNVTTQFAAIAKSVAGHAPGTIFIAADVHVHGHLAGLLPERTVWWSNETQASLDKINTAGNPGTDLSAFVDLYLLTKCKHLICTSSSSFGSIAAAYSNTIPVNVVLGQHEAPFYKPLFWKALNSEPSLYKAGHCCQDQLTKANLDLLSAYHTNWVQLQQWHF
jgi:hypothetical protein